MKPWQTSLPSAVSIALLAGAALALFSSGLCLGAGVTWTLMHPEPRPGLPGPAGSALDHPARPGAAVVAGDLEIRVTGAVRPADDTVMKGSMLNPRPGPGNEMILISLSITCRPTEDNDPCNLIPALDFLLASPAGVHRPKWLVTGLPNLLPSGEVATGETVLGDLVFEVGKEETRLVLVYTESWGSHTAYLAVP
ncbi:MAG: hypothetical protein RML46_08525 [Anaerolineae bacterium]|nr:DUF4352 domain-containing protein [Anaerolineae bacterium]MDW8068942.1 hypothetical protein [Anaerolineae bacterium]